MKIVVVSDNHGNKEVLNKILNDNPDADYYFHLGDSELELNELNPFLCVKGNVDNEYSLPIEKVIDTKECSIYLLHGHAYSADLRLISKAAKMNDCKLALYGHTHIYLDKVVDGVRIINPGSCSRSKDDGNSYVVILINEGNISVNRIYV